METGEWHPTIRQILRATLKISLDALAMPFLRKKTIRYTSDGQTIRGTIYYPESESPAPAVLLLPTAFGLTPHEHSMASRLAREGYTTLVIAYSERTTGAVVKDDARRTRLEQIVVDGLRVLQADPKADANRTAVVGLSLGGYFAIHVATAVEEFAPKAVAVYYGMFALAQTKVVSLRAPLLILQGENDYREFVTNAKRVQEHSVSNEQATEVVMYPHAGHQFDLFEPGSEATQDAWKRTLEFLGQHLEPSASKEKSKVETVL